MKKFTTVAVMVMFLICSDAFAQGKDGLGLGIIIGEPTGLSVKKWFNGDRAFAGGIAWSFADNSSLHFHGDYLVHRFDILSSPDIKGRTPLYYGLGARLKLKEGNRGRGRNDGDALLGARVPVGISYLFADDPIDLFLEVVPVLDVIPKTDFSFNAALGARFYF